MSPLLDARTVSRVFWVSSGDELKKELAPAFDDDTIPIWMGGRNKTDDEIVLFNGKKVICSDMRQRFS